MFFDLAHKLSMALKLLLEKNFLFASKQCLVDKVLILHKCFLLFEQKTYFYFHNEVILNYHILTTTDLYKFFIDLSLKLTKFYILESDYRMFFY